MRRTKWPTHAIVATLAVAAGVAVLAYIADAPLRSAKINDFYSEAWPAYIALAHGHVVGFLTLGPVYVGSLVLRAPFTLVPNLWHGGPRELYFASALPCMISMAAFCTWLAAQPRRNGVVTWASRITPIVCCAFNPLVLITLYGGHPEEILGAVLCIGAVVLAVRGRAGWAGIVVGLAVINKSWALVAVPVVLAVLPGERRRALIAGGVTAAAVLIPVMAVPRNGLSAGASGASVGAIFNPPQLLWWFGSHSLIAREARPLIVLCAVACAFLWWAQRARSRPGSLDLSDALRLLALVMLLRAALDPWNNLYYHVPFLFALMAYEIRSRRMPLLAVFYSFVLLAVVPIRGVPHMSLNLRAGAYAATILPTLLWLVAAIYLRRATWKHTVLRRPPLARQVGTDEVAAA